MTTSEGGEQWSIERHLGVILERAEVDKPTWVAPGSQAESSWQHALDEVASITAKLRELQARREAMRDAEYVDHEATEYDLDRGVCTHCNGLRPADFERLDSWNLYRHHRGHRPGCFYAKYPTEGPGL